MNNPFGDAYQKYWDRRHALFTKFDQGIETDLEGLYSATPEKLADKCATRAGNGVILDAFCGIGANTIAFAKQAEHVFAIELDEERIRLAQNNVRVYGLEEKVTFIHGDYFDHVGNVKADVVFIAPPWGGPDYAQKETFLLTDFTPDGNKILKAAFTHFSTVILQIPKI